jgi:biopolymer transport protein ExbD/biopolymer transport protein TolR
LKRADEGPGSRAPRRRKLGEVRKGAEMSIKQKAQPPVADINVTPMVDVMLVMLIIFMVITPMLSHGVSVTLVPTKNPINMADAEKEDAIVVAVTRDGKTVLGTTPTNPEELPGKVKDLLVNRLSKMTYVKADTRAMYSKVVEVVDNLRAAGVDQIGLMTDIVDEKAAKQQ